MSVCVCTDFTTFPTAGWSALSKSRAVTLPRDEFSFAPICVSAPASPAGDRAFMSPWQTGAANVNCFYVAAEQLGAGNVGHCFRGKRFCRSWGCNRDGKVEVEGRKEICDGKVADKGRDPQVDRTVFLFFFFL